MTVKEKQDTAMQTRTLKSSHASLKFSRPFFALHHKASFGFGHNSSKRCKFISLYSFIIQCHLIGFSLRRMNLFFHSTVIWLGGRADERSQICEGYMVKARRYEIRQNTKIEIPSIEIECSLTVLYSSRWHDSASSMVKLYFNSGNIPLKLCGVKKFSSDVPICGTSTIQHIHLLVLLSDCYFKLHSSDIKKAPAFFK